MKRAIVAALLGGLFMGSGLDAAVYRWLDENGQVVYSQVPPPGQVQAEKIRVNAPPPAAAVEKPDGMPDEEPEGENGGNPALDPALRKEYCDRAGKVLEVLAEATPDMEFLTEDGKTVKYTREELEQKKKEAGMAVKAYCD